MEGVDFFQSEICDIQSLSLFSCQQYKHLEFSYIVCNFSKREQRKRRPQKLRHSTKILQKTALPLTCKSEEQKINYMFKNRDYGDNNVKLAENYKEMARKKKKQTLYAISIIHTTYGTNTGEMSQLIHWIFVQEQQLKGK